MFSNMNYNLGWGFFLYICVMRLENLKSGAEYKWEIIIFIYL